MAAKIIDYDNNGNLTSDGVNTYTWDRANRMLTAPGNTAYTYDGLGNRVSQTVNSVLTEYLLDTQPGLTKVIGDSDGNRFIHAPRGIHAMEDNADNWTYAMQDALGNVRSEVDSLGGIGFTQDMTAYLTPTNQNGAGVMPFGATGEQMDDNGLLYLRARYYDPSRGMFPSLDPFEGMMQRPMSLNGYSWVEGNPVMNVDPTGMCTWLIGGCATALATGFIPFVDEAFACGLLFGCGLTTGTIGTLLPLLVEELIEVGGLAIAEAERIVDNAFRRHENRNEEPEPTPTPTPYRIPFPQGDPLPDPNPNDPCPDEDEDDDCLDGKPPWEAAHDFAEEAQLYWLAGTHAAGAGAPLTTAVTVVKLGSECVKHVSISNPLNTPIPERIRRYQDAFDGISRAIGISGVRIGFREPNTYPGVEGHAERLLYNVLGDSIEAMGVSQIPCGAESENPHPNSCSVWFRSKRISIAYWDKNSGGTRTFQ